MVTADEESFTAVRHHMIRSMTTSQVTATSSLDALAAAADAAARAALHILNLPPAAAALQAHAEGTPEISARYRHRGQGSTGKPQVTVFAPGLAGPGQDREAARKEECPASRGRGPWNRPPFPPRHAGPGHVLTPSGSRSCRPVPGTPGPQHPRKSETPKVRAGLFRRRRRGL